MADSTKPVPTLRKHVDGRYTARLSGRDYYFGRERGAAVQQYHCLIGLWLAGGRRLPASSDVTPDEGMLVGELVLAYLEFAEGYYVGDDGQPTGQLGRIRAAVRPLVELYDAKPAGQFSPVDLLAVREHTLRHRSWVRRTVNHYVSIIKTMFRWGVERGHVPANVWHGVLSVKEIPPGRTHAREPEPVPPIADVIVEMTLPHMPAAVADAVRVQRLTGMRPGEVVLMRGVPKLDVVTLVIICTDA